MNNSINRRDYSVFSFFSTIILTQIINFFIIDNFEPMTAYFLNVAMGSALYMFTLHSQKSRESDGYADQSDKEFIKSYSNSDIWTSYATGVANGTLMMFIFFWDAII